MRSMGPMVRAQVVADDCIGCGNCVEMCPMEAIAMEGEKAMVLEHCTGCMMCMRTCPTGAIQPAFVEPEVAQTGTDAQPQMMPDPWAMGRGPGRRWRDEDPER